MKKKSSVNVEIRPFDGPLGAEVLGVDLAKELDEKTKSKVLSAWHRHLVLLFRKQTPNDSQLVEFSKMFGELEMAPPNKSGRHWIDGFPELACISNLKVAGQPIGSLGNGEAIWHTDMSFMESPPDGEPPLCP